MKSPKQKLITIIVITVMTTVFVMIAGLLVYQRNHQITINGCPNERLTEMGTCLPKSQCVGPADGIIACDK